MTETQTSDRDTFGKKLVRLCGKIVGWAFIAFGAFLVFVGVVAHIDEEEINGFAVFILVFGVIVIIASLKAMRQSGSLAETTNEMSDNSQNKGGNIFTPDGKFFTCECGGKVSVNAKSCPHCGDVKALETAHERQRARQSRRTQKWPNKSEDERAARTIMICAVLAVIVYMLYSLDNNDTASDAPQHTASPQQPTPPKPAPAVSFKSHGYMQMKNNMGGRFRIMAFELSAGASPQSISAHGNKQPITQPGFTQVFYYPQGTPSIPGHDLTLTEDGGIDKAHEVIRAYSRRGGKWRYVFQHYIGGGTELIDCVKNPQAELCPDKL